MKEPKSTIYHKVLVAVHVRGYFWVAQRTFLYYTWSAKPLQQTSPVHLTLPDDTMIIFPPKHHPLVRLVSEPVAHRYDFGGVFVNISNPNNFCQRDQQAYRFVHHGCTAVRLWTGPLAQNRIHLRLRLSPHPFHNVGRYS